MANEGSFGSWLKVLRKALDLTQTELADQVGCAAVTIQKIERDVARPSKQIAARLADVLALSPDERIRFVALARHTAEKHPTLPLSSHRVDPLDKLPLQSTPFVGRVTELVQIANSLGNTDCRQLTLVGEGGIGKTRLALQAARGLRANFADGVYFVALAPLT